MRHEITALHVLSILICLERGLRPDAQRLRAVQP
jgi:hypothetical protein